jgi:hypothetical protein
MTKLIVFLFSLCCIYNICAQENPWVQSSGENPWIAKDTTKMVITVHDSLQISYIAKGYKETDANGALAIGFTTTLVANVFGTIPALFSLAVPSKNERNAENTLTKDKPQVTQEDIKQYKKGVLKKRTHKTFTGMALGIASNTVIILILIFN